MADPKGPVVTANNESQSTAVKNVTKTTHLWKIRASAGSAYALMDRNLNAVSQVVGVAPEQKAKAARQAEVDYKNAKLFGRAQQNFQVEKARNRDVAPLVTSEQYRKELEEKQRLEALNRNKPRPGPGGNKPF